MFADAHPHIEFDGTPPMPDRVLPAPDELHSHIQQHHKGLHRISVKIMHGRRRYSGVGAIKVGAGYDEVPEASPDDLVAAVMAIACDHVERLDKRCKFLVQSHTYKTPTGDPVRKGVHIELGDSRDMEGSYVEQIEDPEKLDSVLLSHIRQCHTEILNQAKVIGEIGKAAIKNAGEVFAAKEDAIQARAEVMQHLAETRIEGQIARNEDKRKGEMMEMLREAVGVAIKQMNDRKKSEKFAGFQSPATTSSQTQTPETQAAPSFLDPTTIAATATETTKPTKNKADMPTIAKKLKTILSSLDDDQIAKLKKALTKTQWAMLESATATRSDKAAKPIIAKFAASVERRPMTILKVARVLPSDATNALMEIWRAA